MRMTLARGCEIADDYPPSHLIDERVTVRRECGHDFLTQVPAGKALVLDLDDAAALCGYADLRRAGYPVKLAGTITGRIRAAMRDYPDADQFVSVMLENGNTFTLPAEMLDLASGYNSGGYIVTATLIDVRNLRERVRRATEVEDAAA